MFCGRSGSLTREHAVPAWFGRLFSPHAQFEITDRSETARQHVYAMAKLNIVGRSFCAPCNSGWMSKLEDEARPLLTQLILGAEYTLDAHALDVLARWSAKTALAYATTIKQDIPVARTAAREYYQDKLPPSHCLIYIGRYTPNTAPLHAAKSCQGA